METIKLNFLFDFLIRRWPSSAKPSVDSKVIPFYFFSKILQVDFLKKIALSSITRLQKKCIGRKGVDF
jgi:hypothetical protein